MSSAANGLVFGNSNSRLVTDLGHSAGMTFAPKRHRGSTVGVVAKTLAILVAPHEYVAPLDPSRCRHEWPPRVHHLGSIPLPLSQPAERPTSELASGRWDNHLH